MKRNEKELTDKDKKELRRMCQMKADYIQAHYEMGNEGKITLEGKLVNQLRLIVWKLK